MCQFLHIFLSWWGNHHDHIKYAKAFLGKVSGQSSVSELTLAFQIKQNGNDVKKRDHMVGKSSSHEYQSEDHQKNIWK